MYHTVEYQHQFGLGHTSAAGVADGLINPHRTKPTVSTIRSLQPGQVDLPRIKAKGAAAAAAAAADAEADADDAMDAEGPGASADGDDVAVAGGDVAAAVALQLAALDASALKRSLQAAMPAREREATEAGMKGK